MSLPHRQLSLAVMIVLALSACREAPDSAGSPAPAPDIADQQSTPQGLIEPERWPLQQPVMRRDPNTERRIEDLMSRMTLEEKVGQVIEADIASVTPEQVRQYNLGSVLNGGGSAPDGNLRNTPESWLALADAFWAASTDTEDGGVGIPVIWGTDAVHGHSNVVGATVFPHNIGLGAANDPDLMVEIGRATALEVLATGLDWTFAPTLAVVRDDRWGRTYESYSEDPRIVAAYAPRMVEGLQGEYGTDEFLGAGRIIATAKHFVGDGGTRDGIDQGDNVATEAELRDIHAAGYPPAIAAGVQTVMASYSSFHGHKMHGFKEMLTDVLVRRMGFDGFAVGDWNGHGQLEGCTNESCPASFNAGLDMFMAPDSWQGLYRNTLEQVRSGGISEARLDEAVARILRVKFRAGVFEAPRPSERPHGGDWSLIGAPRHRAVAREAVRKSLVLLKNEGGLLPLAGDSSVLVAGSGANDIGKQSGGWTLSWQGTGNTNANFPNGASIFDGILETVTAAGGKAVLSEDGSWTDRPDVAIVVFGEDPYAEFQGDRATVDYAPDDGLTLLRKLRGDGIPTVSVFISGRPLWVNPELNVSDVFVAAWLPGTEGGGIADVLFADPDGNPRFDFTGRLSFSWPATAAQTAVNVGDTDYDPLFPYGYGLHYGDSVSVPELPEDPGTEGLGAFRAGQFIEFGDPVGAWQLQLRDAQGSEVISDTRGSSPGGNVSMVPMDNEIQEDTFVATWSGEGSLVVFGDPVDFQREANGDLVMELVYQVLEADLDKAEVGMGRGAGQRGSLDVTEPLTAQSGGGWQSAYIRLACFVEKGARMESITEPLVISADGDLQLQVASVRLVANPGLAGCDL